MQELNDIKSKLLKSGALNSLIVESKVFKELSKLSWTTHHSPFFLDPTSQKLRELDIKGRKYFSKDSYSCDIAILIECKSLINYHIIANNRDPYGSNFDFIWTGNYIDKENFTKLDELLFKYNFSTEETNYVKDCLEEYCFPTSHFRWSKYSIGAFDIPTFNSFRESNINTTKETDNSVIWKCIMSLQSAIDAHERFLLNNIESMIRENLNLNISWVEKIENVIGGLIGNCDHISFLHPVIIVESKLWEFSEKNELNEMKYFRLNIQKFFEEPLWVDIVCFDHMEEYLKKTKEYISIHKRWKFEVD